MSQESWRSMRTRGRIPNRANVHPWQEGHNASEPSHRAGKGAMGALQTWRGYMGAGGCHAIGTSIFVQFYGTLRRYQCSILFKFCKALRTVLLKGEGNVTPRFWPRCIRSIWCIYCKWSWCGAKGQGPTIDRLCYVLDLNLSPMVYRGMRHILWLSSCKYASIIN